MHSLVRLLCQYKVQLRYVAPAGLSMPDHVRELVDAKGVPQTEMQSLEEAIIDADVVYVTRVQRERFSDPEEYERAKGQLVITPKLMTRAKRKMAVLHPLPRLNEIRYTAQYINVTAIYGIPIFSKCSLKDGSEGSI